MKNRLRKLGSSSNLQGIFPAGVIVSTYDISLARASNLGPAERRQLQHLAGRECAIAALREIEVSAVRIPTESSGAPLWPPGVVGSISHHEMCCCAVVARNCTVAGLGIDVIFDDDIQPDLWPFVLTAREASRLSSLSRDKAALVAGIIFAAKEAYYKCVFPLSAHWLDFADVEIAVDLHKASVTIFDGSGHAPAFPVSGGFRAYNGVVVCGIYASI